MIGAALASATPAAAASRYADVPSSHYASAAIRYTAEERNWLSVGGDQFGPEKRITKRVFARALVRAFAPNDIPSTAIKFDDLPVSDPFWKYAAVAVKRKWLTTYQGDFGPTWGVKKRQMNRALVRALGLMPEVAGLYGIKTADGNGFKMPAYFGYNILAAQLKLDYNFETAVESQEVANTAKVTRAFAAHALWRADMAIGSWSIQSLAKYRSITLPNMSGDIRKAAEFAMQWAGSPYVYAGEWYKPTSGGCCGSQPVGGFDCSGYVWWVMKAPDGSWDNTSIRGYTGWRLPERVSRDMARSAPTRLAYRDLKPMDLVFFDTDDSGRGWSDVDHVGMYLGNGWMIHSSGSRGGVSIDWIADGWWQDRLLWGRRL